MIEIVYRNSEPLKKSTPKQHLDELCQKFYNWLVRATPGDQFCYYSGDYVAGKTVGRMAFRAYESGEVSLFQRKEGTRYHYYAKKLKR